jgi:P-type conjugative transfer ATPase TrbB
MNTNTNIVELPTTTYDDRLIRALTVAIGPDILEFMNDPGIVEVLLNPDGCIWIDRLGHGLSDTGLQLKAEKAQQVINYVATSVKAVCNPETPILSAELPGTGHRFQGFVPPVVEAPVFSIRKKAVMVFTLDDYVRQKIMTVKQKREIIKAVNEKKNILIVGGTGTGKTTLANAILDEIAKTGDRIIIIEDTRELQCNSPDKVYLRSCAHVSMDELLKGTMRMRPDRIVVGEVRGKEALTLLDAWNTGHPGGLCSLHANSALKGLSRLEQLVQRVSMTPQKEFIGEAINIIIYIERYQRSRRIKEIIEVEGYKNGEYIVRQV